MFEKPRLSNEAFVIHHFADQVRRHNVHLVCFADAAGEHFCQLYDLMKILLNPLFNF